MSAGQQVPPWLQEQLAKMQQDQQNLQSILAQRQQLDMEKAEAEKALTELKKSPDGEPVYKHAGSILIKSGREELLAEIEEKKELCETRFKVIQKQEERLKAGLKERETKINEMIKGESGQLGAGAPK